MVINVGCKKFPPNEVIVDVCAAIIGAVVQAFSANKSTKDYITSSFNKLNINEKTPEETYIRIDTSHFVKILYNLTCFKNVDSRVKSFYSKCLLCIKSLNNYDRVKEIISDLITVCLNKFVNPEARCESALLRLKQILKNEPHNETEKKTVEETKTSGDSVFRLSEHCTSNIKEQSIEDDTPILVESSNVPKWYSDQIDKENLFISLTDDEEPDSHENLYYLPIFLETLTRLITQLPLWSNIMMPIYNSECNVPSSSNVGSYFKTIKRYLCDIATKSQTKS